METIEKTGKIALDITPETKIAALLKAYPQLEPVLMQISPTFGKLQNPVLRKTVAKVASLRQAAVIGNVQLGGMINRLRAAAGLASELSISDSGGEAWKEGQVDRAKIVESFDARPMIETGGHPMNLVLEKAERLNPGEIFELVTPFLPAPLIEILQAKGYKVAYNQAGENEYRTFIQQ